ncbi:MAG: hypothetical protein CL693_04045 [Cellvibrionaceae bacterium]|nr:hypothetical protein [Cellvibrionaceae bacterium]|tara:strand:+ start:678 stop:1268 length:591 start_codon:yes stop_codon:yes gene_type:complete
MATSTKLESVLTAIDQKNAQDPNTVEIDNCSVAKELLYGQRMSQRLQSFASEASEHLQIACRAQHIQRWAIARKDYPMDRAGYKRWRSDLAKFHAELTAEIMAEHDYTDADCERVKHLLQKKQLKRDAETQTLEDVACLVFLEFHLDDFASGHSDEKVIDIVRKTWAKMSSDGHAAALQLSFSDAMGALIQKALNP